MDDSLLLTFVEFEPIIKSFQYVFHLARQLVPVGQFWKYVSHILCC